MRCALGTKKRRGITRFEGIGALLDLENSAKILVLGLCLYGTELQSSSNQDSQSIVL